MRNISCFSPNINIKRQNKFVTNRDYIMLNTVWLFLHKNVLSKN